MGQFAALAASVNNSMNAAHLSQLPPAPRLVTSGLERLKLLGDLAKLALEELSCHQTGTVNANKSSMLQSFLKLVLETF